MKHKKPSYETLARTVRRLKAEVTANQDAKDQLYITASRYQDEAEQIRAEIERLKSDKLRLCNLCTHQAKSLTNWFGSWSNKQNECCQLRAENTRLQDLLEQFQQRQTDNAMRKILEMEAA